MSSVSRAVPLRADRHDETDRRFSKLCERAKNRRKDDKQNPALCSLTCVNTSMSLVTNSTSKFKDVHMTASVYFLP